MELEFSVDPLFKKVAADFDEGGAKGLLLNHLAIDGNGRIIFDSSDDVENASNEAESDRRKNTTGQEWAENEPRIETTEINSSENEVPDQDIAALGAKFFPDLDRLEEQDICPSLKNFDLGDPAGSLDIPFLKAADNWRQEEKAQHSADGLGDQTGIFLDGDNVAGFDDEDGALGGFDMGGDAGFGEGGEAWAQNAMLEPQTNIQEAGYEGEIGGGQEDGIGIIGVGDFQPGDHHYAVSMRHQQNGDRHEDILSYFDNALQKNWAGPEHWRIRRMKDLTKTSMPAPSKRKEKEPFEIDFNAPLDASLADMLYAPAASNSAITLPKTQWKSKTRNLLPDDKHFNSRQLLRLFLKPKARMGTRRLGIGGQKQRQMVQTEDVEGEMDEAFWARKENDANHASPNGDGLQGDYDANFFQDDGLGFQGGPPDDEEEFADAREDFSPGAVENEQGQSSNGMRGGPEGSQEGAFGTQLVTQSRRLRPEYVQYARVAKKVDVRKLKEEMWRGIGFEEVSQFVKSVRPLCSAYETPGDTTRQSSNNRGACRRLTASQIHICHEQSTAGVSERSYGGYIDFLLLYLPAPLGERKRAHH